ALGRYGVTANSIAPGAATRMTDTVPDERRLGGAPVRAESAEGTERDPANIAPTCLYLASEEGGWITGKCFGVAGFRVTLYNNIAPQVVLQGTEPWSTGVLFERFPQAFGQAIPESERPKPVPATA
ncbi:SDR family oxidoreductase, partial [bacterium]